MIELAPRQLDRNIALVGRVVQGMERLAALRRGSGTLGFYEQPSQYVPIRRVRVAAGVPETERVRLEVLRTDTAIFDALPAHFHSDAGGTRPVDARGRRWSASG